MPRPWLVYAHCRRSALGGRAGPGGVRPNAEPYLTWRAQEIFQKAYLASQVHMIAQRGWRAGFSVELDGAPVALWIIHGHSYSDGIVIGYGPGDFWPAASRL